jgi:translation initiation factor 3 subunit I
LQFSKDKTHFITASKDHSAIIMDAESLEVIKKFQTERPVNSASLSPLCPHIMLGGGQDAMAVTTTSSKQEKFDVRFFHEVFEEEIGRVKGHFGPVNTLAFHPSGKGFASGGEDGFIRVHKFDPDYFKFKYPEEKEQ